jgi:PEGA domain-containing protein
MPMEVRDALSQFPAEQTFVGVACGPVPVRTPSSSPVRRASRRSWGRSFHAWGRSLGVSLPLVAFALGFATAASLAWLVSTVSGQSIAAPAREPSVSSTTAALGPAAAPVATFTPAAVEGSPAGSVRAVTDERPAVAVPRRETARPALVSSSAARATTDAQYRGVLAVSSVPQGAEVVLNGTLLGTTPLVVEDLPVGSRAVVVRRDGYRPWSSSIRVVANQRTVVTANLGAASTP